VSFCPRLFVENRRKDGSLWKGSTKNGEERHASQKAWHAQVWQGRKRGNGQEQKTGDRDWTFGSAKEGREGSAEKSELMPPGERPLAVEKNREAVIE
jgi:hypothetical protein